jgi:hypothetical protein
MKKATCNETFLNKKIIKEGLKKLTLCNYNIGLRKGDLPDSLEELYLLRYNQPLGPGSIPSSVKILYLGEYDLDLNPGCLPNSLEELTLKNFNKQIFPGSIPLSVKYLDLSDYNQVLADDIELNPDITIGTSARNNIFLSNIPITIKNLEVGQDFPVDLSNLPVGLEKLKIWYFNKNNLTNIKIPFGCQLIDRKNEKIDIGY